MPFTPDTWYVLKDVEKVCATEKVDVVNSMLDFARLRTLPNLHSFLCPNANGKRSSLKATIGATNDFLNAYTYDDMHRLKEIEQSQQSTSSRVASKDVLFTCDAARQLTAVKR